MSIPVVYALFRFGLVLWCLTQLFTIFHLDIVVVSFIGGGNRSTRRKPPTCRKSRTNFITGFVTRLTRRVQELPTLPEHLSSLPVFSGVRLTRSLVLCVCFVDRCLSFCTFSFGHYVVCSSSIYRNTDSDYPFDIFKLFFQWYINI